MDWETLRLLGLKTCGIGLHGLQGRTAGADPPAQACGEREPVLRADLQVHPPEAPRVRRQRTCCCKFAPASCCKLLAHLAATCPHSRGARPLLPSPWIADTNIAPTAHRAPLCAQALQHRARAVVVRPRALGVAAGLLELQAAAGHGWRHQPHHQARPRPHCLLSLWTRSDARVGKLAHPCGVLCGGVVGCGHAPPPPAFDTLGAPGHRSDHKPVYAGYMLAVPKPLAERRAALPADGMPPHMVMIKFRCRPGRRSSGAIHPSSLPNREGVIGRVPSNCQEQCHRLICPAGAATCACRG